MDIDDFVIYHDKNNNICSGGYVLNNTLQNLKMPSFFGNNGGVQKGGGSVGTIAIPAGLVLMQQIMGDTHNSSQEKRGVGPAPPDLYARLLELVNVPHKREKRMSRKRRRRRKNKSRKR